MIWVETLARGHDLAHRFRIDESAKDRITIGRAYDNDVILDDPYVAPHHLTLLRDPNHIDDTSDSPVWIVEDAGSANGMFIGDDSRRQARSVLADDRVIHIGRTSLRIRTSASRVAPERVLPLPHHGWKLALVLLFAMLSIEAASTWLAETGEVKVSRYAFALIATAAVMLIWATVWALVSRVFSGHAKFERHLLIAASGACAMAFVTEFTDYAAFALSSLLITSALYIVNWLIVGTTLFFHLREISPLHWRLKGIVVSVIAALGIGAQWLSHAEAQKAGGQAQYLTQLHPPAVRLVPAQSTDAFFAETAQLKTKLDKARTEEKVDASVFSAFDFDD